MMSILEQSPSSTVELDHGPIGRLRSLPTPGIIGVGVVAAVAFNTAIWAVGALAGGSFELTDGGKVQTVAPGGVIVFTAVPLLIGLTLAALLARWRPGITRLARLLGSVLRSEEHTSELQSLMRISYAVFCLKK